MHISVSILIVKSRVQLISTDPWEFSQLTKWVSCPVPNKSLVQLVCIVHQLNIAKPSLFVVHYDSLPVALKAAAEISLPRSRIVVIDLPKTNNEFSSLSNLIDGASSLPPFKEFQLKDGQGKTKIAVLIFSSGTTGIPKVHASHPHQSTCGSKCHLYRPYPSRIPTSSRSSCKPWLLVAFMTQPFRQRSTSSLRVMLLLEVSIHCIFVTSTESRCQSCPSTVRNFVVPLPN